MKSNFIDFFNSMQTCQKFKQFVEGDYDVINDLTSFMMEDTTLARIKASLTKASVANEAIGSFELVGANEQVHSNVVTVGKHQQTNVHTIEEQMQKQ
jgi:hypothetical protein